MGETIGAVAGVLFVIFIFVPNLKSFTQDLKIRNQTRYDKAMQKCRSEGNSETICRAALTQLGVRHD